MNAASRSQSLSTDQVILLGPDAPELDIMHNILHFAKIMRSVPLMPAVDRWLQFVGIHEVAQDIATDVSETSQGTKVRYRNHCGVETDWVRGIMGRRRVRRWRGVANEKEKRWI